MKGFVKYCKEFILEKIDDFEGKSVYACDFPMMITEGINMDGTCTYNREEAIDYIREWFYEAGQYWQYEKDNFGEVMHNPFDNPEAYMVCMVIEGCGAILSDFPFIQENWNEEKFYLDKETIDAIKEFVEEFDEDEDLF